MDEDTATERIDQLMRIDPNALIGIIRDLEHKLTEYQRQDKVPAWAQALELRLEQLEKWRSAAPTPATGANDNSSGANTSPPIASSISEDRVMSKVRGEIEAAMSGLHLQLDTKVSAAGLEMERLHKLLQIRPTNSDLQQLVVNIRSIESKTQTQLEEISSNILSTLRGKLSEEMMALLDELKSGSSKSDEHQRLIRTQLSAYVQEIASLRNDMSSQFDSIAGNFVAVNGQVQAGEERMKKIEATHIDDVQKVYLVLRDLKTDLQAAQKIQKEDKKALEDELKAAEGRNMSSFERLGRAQEETQKQVQATRTTLTSVEASLSSLEIQTKLDLQNLNKVVKHIEGILTEEQKRMRQMVQIVEEFNAMDFPGKLARHDEKINQIKYDLHDLQNRVQGVLAQELKMMQGKIHVLEDAVENGLPRLIEDNAVKIQQLFNAQSKMKEDFATEKDRLLGLSEVVDSLLPLKDQAQAFAEKLANHDEELATLKSTVNACIEANEELSQRIDGVEESIETLEQSITERMNSIRDTLLEALLERQTETNQAVVQVSQNLEAMSMAGEVVAEPRQNMGTYIANSVPTTELDLGNALNQGGGIGGVKKSGSPGAVMPQGVTKAISFKRPSMKGVAIGGAGVGGGGPVIGRGQMSILASVPDHIEEREEAAAPLNAATSMPSMVMQRQSFTGARGVIASGGGRGTIMSTPHAASARNSISSAPSSLPLISSTPSKGRETLPLIFAGAAGGGGGGVLASSHGAHKRRGSRVSFSAPADQALSSPRQTPRLSRSPSPSRAENEPSSFSPSFPSSLPLSSSASYEPPSDSLPMSAPSDPLSPRTESLAMEFSSLLGPPASSYPHFQEAQFIADLCSNYEEISLKRKRVANLPPIMCKHMVEIACNMCEIIANVADFEMVEAQLGTVQGSDALLDVTYDEHFVINKRNQRMDEFLQAVLSVLNMSSPSTLQPGIVRYDARNLFMAMMKKALEMFMTKHNQVLVVGNSRLGRVKIPTCIACDRPLLEKVKLDAIQQGAPGASQVEDQSSFSPPTQSRPRTTPLLGFSQSLTSLDHSGGGVFGQASLLSTNSKSDAGGAYVMKAGFKMPKKSLRAQTPGH